MICACCLYTSAAPTNSPDDRALPCHLSDAAEGQLVQLHGGADRRSGHREGGDATPHRDGQLLRERLAREYLTERACTVQSTAPLPDFVSSGLEAVKSAGHWIISATCLALIKTLKKFLSGFVLMEEIYTVSIGGRGANNTISA